MERRELLKIMAMTFGGSVALPESAFAKMGEPFDPNELDFFRPAERQQVAILAEAIIPKTDTPGAIEAGVPGWIEVIVRDCLEPGAQALIKEGLPKTMMSCAKEKGAGLGDLLPEKQVEFLNEYNAGGGKQAEFLQKFKELAKFCYVNSEVGATQAFDYQLVPGKWVPDMPLEAGMKPSPM
ncbi:gluconate 2-dehydrogenase subunit 3 family protein [Akkermansiaceae bacterium]|nr:gluconate 2-dehydrogenase subunit 3 family protein [Akkermansiaceae bacterium]